MCVTNIYKDRYPDGQEFIFRNQSVCPSSIDGHPCSSNITLEHIPRCIQFGETSSAQMFPQTNGLITPPRSSADSHCPSSASMSTEDTRTYAATSAGYSHTSAGGTHRRGAKSRAALSLMGIDIAPRIEKSERRKRKEQEAKKDRIVYYDGPPSPSSSGTSSTYTRPIPGQLNPPLTGNVRFSNAPRVQPQPQPQRSRSPFNIPERERRPHAKRHHPVIINNRSHSSRDLSQSSPPPSPAAITAPTPPSNPPAPPALAAEASPSVPEDSRSRAQSGIRTTQAQTPTAPTTPTTQSRVGTPPAYTPTTSSTLTTPTTQSQIRTPPTQTPTSPITPTTPTTPTTPPPLKPDISSTKNPSHDRGRSLEPTTSHSHRARRRERTSSLLRHQRWAIHDEEIRNRPARYPRAPSPPISATTPPEIVLERERRTYVTPSSAPPILTPAAPNRASSAASPPPALGKVREASVRLNEAVGGLGIGGDVDRGFVRGKDMGGMGFGGWLAGEEVRRERGRSRERPHRVLYDDGSIRWE